MLILGVIHWLHTRRVRPLIRIPLLEPGVIPNKGNWILQNGLIWAALWTANIANSSWRISLLSTLISPLAVIYIGDRPREKGYRPCTKNIEWSSAGIFSDGDEVRTAGLSSVCWHVCDSCHQRRPEFVNRRFAWPLTEPTTAISQQICLWVRWGRSGGWFEWRFWNICG